MLYEIFWILVIFLFFPRKALTNKIALWVFTITCALEILQLVMAWVAGLSFAYGLVTGALPQVTLLSKRLPQRFQRGHAVYVNLMGALCLGLLTYGAWVHFWSSWEVKEPMFSAFIDLPWYIGKLALPAGLFFIVAQFLIYSIGAIKKRGQA